MKIVFHSHDLTWPVQKEPVWAAKVERWYQLDAPAYALVEAFSVLQSKISQNPSILILASPQASMDTDFQFAHSGASSPSKFVHTLPNIRGAPLMQVMEWQGPLLCFQNDPTTWLDGLREALDLCDLQNPEISVIHYQKAHPDGLLRVTWAQVLYSDQGEKNYSNGSQSLLIVEPQLGENARLNKKSTDHDFWQWLTDQSAPAKFSISDQWNVVKAET